MWGISYPYPINIRSFSESHVWKGMGIYCHTKHKPVCMRRLKPHHGETLSALTPLSPLPEPTLPLPFSGDILTVEVCFGSMNLVPLVHSKSFHWDDSIPGETFYYQQHKIGDQRHGYIKTKQEHLKRMLKGQEGPTLACPHHKKNRWKFTDTEWKGCLEQPTPKFCWNPLSKNKNGGPCIIG